MDDGSFQQQFHAIASRSVDEAVRRGARTVEAEHVLLAVVANPRSVASRTLIAAGLSHDAIDAALDQERAKSLAFAGIASVDTASLSSAPRRTRPGWGASVREAMGVLRKLPARDRRKRVLEIELLIGILHAELGTVPRALSIAGIDRIALVERLRNL